MLKSLKAIIWVTSKVLYYDVSLNKTLTGRERIKLQLYVKKKLKVACRAFSALQPVGRLYPCPIEFPSFISRGATHHTGTRDLC